MDSPPASDLERGERDSSHRSRSSSIWLKLIRSSSIWSNSIRSSLSRSNSIRSVSTGETLVESTNVHSTEHRALGTFETVIVMLKSQVGIGVLGIPKAMLELGLVPGLIVLVVVSLITSWTGYTMGVFWNKHRGVSSFYDAGKVLGGKWGGRCFGGGFLFFWTTIIAAAIVSIADGLAVLTDRPELRTLYLFVAFAVTSSGSSIPKLKFVARIAYAGAILIIIALVLLPVGLSRQDRPTAAPQTGLWQSDYQLFNPSATWPNRFAAVSAILFAFSGPTAYFRVVSEVANLKRYNVALWISQTISLAIYATIGSVVYVFCGSSMASPVFASAGPLWKDLCYGFGLPALCISTMLLAHLTSKGILDWICKDFDVHNVKHFLKWLGCTFAVAFTGWLIGNVVPGFEGLLSVIGALFVPVLAMFAPSWMWCHDNRSPERRGLQWWLLAILVASIVVLGIFLMASGMYGSVMAEKSVADSIPGWRPFRSAGNS